MLPTNQLMEALSRAYVRTIAARAGVICDDVLQDYGVDLFIREFAPVGKRYLDVGRQIDLQLKSTTRAALNDKSVLYDLDVPAYNLLRQLSPVPRLLILVVLPEDPLLYLEQSEEQLLLRGCAYWLSLRGPRPPTMKGRFACPCQGPICFPWRESSKCWFACEEDSRYDIVPIR